MNVIINIIFALVCLLTGGLGAWIIQNYGYKYGLIDVPNERSSHTQVVPKGGGIGILLAFVVCGILFDFHRSFWVSGLILSLMSFVGDRLEIKPTYRLMIQLCCSLSFLAGLLYWNGSSALIFLLIIPYAVFITGTANFYNFMDGINGIAGITGSIGFLLLAFYGYNYEGDNSIIQLCTAISFACFGFLPFNAPKARVFMGDVGSVLLGFVFACMVVALSKSFIDFICLSGFLFTFYADELTTMAIRIREGDSLTQPHRKHIYQLLANEYGIDHWKVSVGYGFVQLIMGISIIYLRNKGVFSVLTLYAICFLYVAVLSIYLRYRLKLSTQ